jgi:hypothetical protein
VPALVCHDEVVGECDVEMAEKRRPGSRRRWSTGWRSAN